MIQTNIDDTVQPWCPMENTGYETFCLAMFDNIQMRPSTPCEHSGQCSELKETLDRYAVENKNH
jgi:hypothetical protein